MYTLAYKKQIIPPTPPIDNPTILRVSGAPNTINSSIFIPLNADYIKSKDTVYNNEFNQEQQYVEEDTHSLITKYTMKEFLNIVIENFQDPSAETISTIYIDNVSQSDLNNNTSIYILVDSLGPLGGPNNFLYYKIGDDPVGTYTKNNLSFTYINTNKDETSFDVSEYMDDNQFASEFNMNFNQLPNNITITAIQ